MVKNLMPSKAKVNSTIPSRPALIHKFFADFGAGAEAMPHDPDPDNVREMTTADIIYLASRHRKDAVEVTFFPNQFARTMQRKRVTLAKLEHMIRTTEGATKGELPFVKMGLFSGEVNPNNPDKGCLRYDAGVIGVTGIEGDKDAGRQTFDKAAELLEQAGIRALLYTSSSHTEQDHRFRVICPTSQELAPGERTKLLARLQGILGGSLSGESYTLSQSYYFGRANGSPAPQVRIIDGDRIDQRGDLDKRALAKDQHGPWSPTKAEAAKTSEETDNYFAEYGKTVFRPAVNVEQSLADMYHKGGHGNVHLTELSLIAAYLNRDVDVNEAVATVLARVKEVGPEHWDWSKEEKTLYAMAESWFRKHPELRPAPLPTHLMLSSGEFVGGFVPPDYLIDGLLQRRFVYSMTGPTGSGKTAIMLLLAYLVAVGERLADRDVEQGRVLIFAGENPDDVRTRWIKVCEEMKVNPADVDVYFAPGTRDLSAKKVRALIDKEAEEHGPFSLVFVDTSAAFYSGDDENDNKKLGDHARVMRSLVELPGGPTVIVTCHPTKTPDMSNLVPRGGGAFLAEVDGNMGVVYEKPTKIASLAPHGGKWRGPDFPPFCFELVSGYSDKLVDSKGRSICTVFARAISDTERDEIDERGTQRENELLLHMLDHPGLSNAGYAALPWMSGNDGDDKMNRHKVGTVMRSLAKDKLVAKERENAAQSPYLLTAKGTKLAQKLAERGQTD